MSPSQWGQLGVNNVGTLSHFSVLSSPPAGLARDPGPAAGHPVPLLPWYPYWGGTSIGMLGHVQTLWCTRTPGSPHTDPSPHADVAAWERLWLQTQLVLHDVGQTFTCSISAPCDLPAELVPCWSPAPTAPCQALPSLRQPVTGQVSIPMEPGHIEGMHGTDGLLSAFRDHRSFKRCSHTPISVCR